VNKYHINLINNLMKLSSIQIDVFMTKSIKLIYTASTLVLMNSCVSVEGNEEPLNVVFIITDDQNNWLEASGFDRYSQVKTPNMNRLMEMGVTFTNAHSNNPVCGPSRTSLLSGLYPHTTGYFGYAQQQNHWREFEKLSAAVTIMEHFSNNGYNVYGTGKIFHNGHEDWDVWKSDDTLPSFGYEPSFGPFAWDGSYERGYYDHAMGLPHPKVLDNPDQRMHWGGSFGSLADIPAYPPNSETGAPGYNGWILYTKPFFYKDDNNRDLMPDELNARYARKVLSQDHEKPFFLAVGMNRPHTPFHAPQKYFDMYPLDEIVLPKIIGNDLDDAASALYQDCQTSSCNGFNSFSKIKNHSDPDRWKKIVQAYLAGVTFVDDALGEVIDALEESNHANNTVIIFISDHGYHLGEKSYKGKRTLWEESSNVPLVIAVPGNKNKGKQVTHPVSHIDIYPTLIDLVGLPKNPNSSGNGIPLDGFSLGPFLENPDQINWEGPDFALISVASGEPIPVNQPGDPKKQFYSMRTENYRYTWCPNGEEELFCHKDDPFEWNNLVGEETHKEVLKEFRGKLKRVVLKMN
jgi:arylsulfatase A-like enzyme